MNVADEIRRIDKSLKDIKIRLGGVRVSSQVFSVPPTKTISISPSFTNSAVTLKYSTIQAALTAQAAGGELFLVYPGIYTDDTIHFTADNQTVRGMGISPAKCIVRTADANICDFFAYTGCKVNRIKLDVTGATAVINTAQGSGSCNFVKCHTSMTTAYAVAGAQPACFGGTGTFKIVEGTIDYDHTGGIGTAGGSIKAAINLGAGCNYTVRSARIEITGSGTSWGITIAYGMGASTLAFDRTEADLNDTGSNRVAGVVLGGTGVSEFTYNDLHCCAAAGKTAIGIYITGTPTIRGIFNHIHTEGGTAYSYYITGAATVSSQLEDIMAVDGTINTGGIPIKYVNSPSDGNFEVSESIGTSALIGTEIATPANPAAGYNKLYFKNDDKLYKLDSAGNEVEIG